MNAAVALHWSEPARTGPRPTWLRLPSVASSVDLLKGRGATGFNNKNLSNIQYAETHSVCSLCASKFVAAPAVRKEFVEYALPNAQHRHRPNLEALETQATITSRHR